MTSTICAVLVCSINTDCACTLRHDGAQSLLIVHPRSFIPEWLSSESLLVRGARPSHKSEIGVDRAGEHRGCLSDISRTMQLSLWGMTPGKMQSITCSVYGTRRLGHRRVPAATQLTSNKHFDSVSPKSRTRCSKSQSRLELDWSQTRALFCGPLN